MDNMMLESQRPYVILKWPQIDSPHAKHQDPAFKVAKGNKGSKVTECFQDEKWHH